MRPVIELIDRVAKTNISVLLVGETGVGKELLAREVHERSPRARRPILRLAYASLSESHLEYELFGYEKDAFPGATEAKPGLFEVTDGGTVPVGVLHTRFGRSSTSPRPTNSRPVNEDKHARRELCYPVKRQ